MSNPPGKRLDVLVLSDGRPGHYNKSKAILLALASHYDVHTQWIETRLRSGLWRPLLAALIRFTRWAPAPSRLKRFYQADTLPGEVPDLVISTGGNTLYANALLARHFHCRNLFIGSTRKVPADAFWRILTHRKLSPAPPYLVWPITPVAIQAAELKTRADKLIGQLGLQGKKLWTLLLGGDGGGFRFTADDFRNIAQMLRLANESEGVQWLVISSRRTGRENEQLLKELLSPEWIAATSWSSDEGSNLYHAFLGAAERIVCTEDSHMMMTEAIASGRPVLSVRPEHGTAANTHFLPAYEENGLISRQTISDAARHGTRWVEREQASFSLELEKLGDLLHRELTVDQQP